MFLETNEEKILEMFMKKPTEGFQVRDIARLSKLGNPTVARILKKIKTMELVKKIKGKVYPYYEANLDSYLFKKLKLAYSLLSIEKLIKEIAAKTRPNCIVLFGSGAKGEDTEKSDIDLCVVNKEGKKNIKFSKFELLFKLEINPIYLKDKEFKHMLKEEEQNLAKEIIKKHIILYGEEYFWNLVWKNGI